MTGGELVSPIVAVSVLKIMFATTLHANISNHHEVKPTRTKIFLAATNPALKNLLDKPTVMVTIKY